MKILLTGGSGFIGKYLKSHLDNTHEVIAPSSKELNLIDRNSVMSFFENQHFDVVIHSAVVGREMVSSISEDIGTDILLMFMNLVEQDSHYEKFINFGSGAEFGLDTSIDKVSEESIFDQYPKEGYGLAKNIIARTIRNLSNFYNLRIFSCLDPSESEKRLVKKFKSFVDQGLVFEIENNRYVDFVSLKDLSIVVDAVLEGKITDNDVNVVYQNKLTVADLLYKYCDINEVDPSLVKVVSESEINYTGDGSKLVKIGLELEGIGPTLAKYKLL